jgi:hypothetical protein
VLAGFWPQLRGYFHDQAQDDGDDLVDDLDGWCDALDIFFDVSLAIPDRLVKAAKYLTDHVGAATYLTHVIDVGTYGARKYERDNWLHVDGGVERYYEAVGRHVRDVILGDWRDEESGCVNLGHIAWGILAGAELVRRVRPKSEFYEHDFTGVGGTQPALKLPLEVGKRYKLTCPHIPLDEGVFVAETFSSSEVSVGDGWLFNVATGEALAGEEFRLTGPVEP